MTPAFDLTRDEWVPVITLDGEMKKVGLRDVLLLAHQYREIYHDSPTVTVSLLRLVLAIMYRCWQFADDEEWDEGWAQLWRSRANGLDPVPIETYFSEWQDGKQRFYLFHQDYPFFQMPTLEIVKEATKVTPERITRLINDSPDWGFANLWNRGEYEMQDWEPGRVARLLVAAQAFGLSASNSSACRIFDVVYKHRGRMSGITQRGMTVYLSGISLAETLLLNFVPADGVNVPSNDIALWEVSPGQQLEAMRDSWKTPQRPQGLAERYTWGGRLARVKATASGIEKLHFTYGRSYISPRTDPSSKSAPIDLNDPMKAHLMSKEKGWSLIELRGDRAAWRDAHALIRVASTNPNEKSPRVVRVAADRVRGGPLERSALLNLHIVGMASGGRGAKISLWRHDRMPVPTGLLLDETLVDRLRILMDETGDRKADRKLRVREGVAQQLYARTKRLARLYLAPNCEARGGRKPDPKDVASLVDQIDPRRAFWPRLEPHFAKLLLDLPIRAENACDEWRDQVEREAVRAFAESCRALGITSSAMNARAVAALARVNAWFICGLNRKGLGAHTAAQLLERSFSDIAEGQTARNDTEPPDVDEMNGRDRE
jgi:CRISPR system Cascade subunit CasA